MSKNVNIQLGGSSTMLLTIVLVILKALDYLSWPWIWVFSPLWIPLAIFLSIFIIILGIGFIAALLK